MSNLPKFELKLQEQAEIGFEVSIQGTVSEGDMGTPIYRFLVTDPETQKGWVFPAKKNLNNDVVNVKLFPAKEGWSPNKSYKGKLEIIVGNSLYFAPTEVLLEFTNPLQVNVKPMVSTKNGSNELTEPEPKKPLNIFVENPQVIVASSKEEDEIDELQNAVMIENNKNKIIQKPKQQQKSLKKEHNSSSFTKRLTKEDLMNIVKEIIEEK